MEHSEPEPTFSFSRDCLWWRPDDDHLNSWRDRVASGLKTIKNQQGGKAQSLLRQGFGLLRQGAIRHGLNVGPIKVDGADQERAHAIVTEIDSRRVFYEQFAFEDPRYCFESVQVCRAEVRALARGVWADKLLESLVQDLQHQLAAFVTESGPHLPPPSDRGRHTSREFFGCLQRMRLDVWAIIVFIMERVGSVVAPKHLPEWLVEEMRAIAENES